MGADVSDCAGVWTNGKRQVTGRWEWFWSAQRFVIWLDGTDRTTGGQRRIEVAGDHPEWGNWKLVRAASAIEAAEAAETTKIGSVHESAVANGETPNPSSPSEQGERE